MMGVTNDNITFVIKNLILKDYQMEWETTCKLHIDYDSWGNQYQQYISEPNAFMW